MRKQDFTTELLDLECVIVTKTENISGALHVSIELPRLRHCCPACKGFTGCIHNYRM